MNTEEQTGTCGTCESDGPVSDGDRRPVPARQIWASSAVISLTADFASPNSIAVLGSK